jgi:catechol 2,3-dioxygenase-like lactoylglutathione lyase family enzyme
MQGFAFVRIAVPDIHDAIEAFTTILGEPDNGAESVCWPLANTGIELVEASGKAAHIAALGLWATDGARLPDNRRGLALALVGDRRVRDRDGEDIRAVDHVVLRSGDADDCIRLFRDDLGMRLALDKSVPEWGGRMLFFRCGKMTLEIIQSLDTPVESDHFWGISYLCGNLDATLRRLSAAGVQHSAARTGRKPGTRVATIKSHTLGIPTLLIEQTPRDSRSD